MTATALFTVGSISVEAEADDVSELWAVQPYAVGTNLWLREGAASPNRHRLVVKAAKRPLRCEITADGLAITGDRSVERARNHNPQFAIFGNKGIAQQFLIHLLEQSGTAVLHAAAVAHPTNERVLVGLGSSGSGKTAFVCSALEAGWRLVASELVLIDVQGRLYAGNRLDNISPAARAELSARLPSVRLYPDRRLVEPVGEKFLVDFAGHADAVLERQLARDSYDIAVLAFGRGPAVQDLRDDEFLRRVIQHAACEKAVSAPVYGAQMFAAFAGNPSARSEVVERLLRDARRAFVIGGGMTEFRRWCEREFTSEV